MKIAVNTRLLLKNKLEGIGWFTYETLKRIVKNHPQHEFYFFFDWKPDPEFVFASNVKPVVIMPPARRPLLWHLWFQKGVSKKLNALNIDVFLSTDGFIPLNTKVPTLNVIHDINFEHYPQFMPKRYARYYLKYFRQFAKKATRLATVSEYSKADIAKTYQVDTSKIDVVYNGVNKSYKPSTDIEIKTIKSFYSDSEKYFLFIGSIHPRKNLNRILLAFDKFMTEQKKPCKMLVVGEKMWKRGANEYQGEIPNERHIKFLGNVPPKKLKHLISGAEALVYTSLFEGFGIPILEGFACNTPLITSNTTSMPEIAKNACLIVDPISVDEICDAMTKLYDNTTLRTALVNKGTQRLQDFSWDKTAKLLWESVLKTVDA